MPPRIQYHGKPIGSRKTLAATLGCELSRLIHISDRTDEYYDSFFREKKSGKPRCINAPKNELKAIQKRINSRIFKNCSFPIYLQGSIKDPDMPRDFVSNASAHTKGKSFILADICDFYPSIKAKHIHDVFKYLLNFPNDVTQLLVRLTTLDGELPQGAPTSSYLANLVFYDEEFRLAADFERSGLIYTRLIDDITVSSTSLLTESKKLEITNKIRSMVSTKGMRLHKEKLKRLDAGGPGVAIPITGLMIEKGQPRLPSSIRKKIRAEVYSCKKRYEAGAMTTNDFHSQHNGASGRVALMTRLKHSGEKEYRDTLRGCLPEYDKKKERKITALCYRLSSKNGAGSHTIFYAKRYHKYMYFLGILSRSNPSKAKGLRLMLKTHRPTIKLSEVQDEIL